MVAGRARKPSKRALEAQGLDQSVSKPITHKKQRSRGSNAGSSAEHSTASADNGQGQGKLLQLSDFPVELIYKVRDSLMCLLPVACSVVSSVS